MKTTTLLALTCAIALGGCSTSDPFASTLEARGLEASQVADDYKRGQKLVEEGRDNVDEGRALVRRGNQRVERGQDQIRDGEALKTSAKAAYCAQVGAADEACI